MGTSRPITRFRAARMAALCQHWSRSRSSVRGVARRPPTPRSSPAPTARPPSRTALTQFGYANGTVSDMGSSRHVGAAQRHRLGHRQGRDRPCAAALGSLSRRRARAGRSTTTSSARCSQRGLTWLPEIHESHSGHYTLPGSSPGGYSEWQQAITQIVQHYGPGGTYQQAHPSFPGITRFELWNEPNTPTGNANPSCGSCQMAPATYDTILKDGSLGAARPGGQAGLLG